MYQHTLIIITIETSSPPHHGPLLKKNYFDFNQCNRSVATTKTRSQLYGSSFVHFILLYDDNDETELLPANAKDQQLTIYIYYIYYIDTDDTVWHCRLRMVYSTVDSHLSFTKGDRINNACDCIVNKFLFGCSPQYRPSRRFSLGSTTLRPSARAIPLTAAHLIRDLYPNNRWFRFRDLFDNKTDTVELIFSPL